jgi:hypothetical protein
VPVGKYKLWKEINLTLYPSPYKGEGNLNPSPLQGEGLV